MRVPIGGGGLADTGGTGDKRRRSKPFAFQVDAELIVYGTTSSDATVMLQGEPINLRKDGTFTMRFSLPEGRQIIPAVANSRAEQIDHQCRYASDRRPCEDANQWREVEMHSAEDWDSDEEDGEADGGEHGS